MYARTYKLYNKTDGMCMLLVTLLDQHVRTSLLTYQEVLLLMAITDGLRRKISHFSKSTRFCPHPHHPLEKFLRAAMHVMLLRFKPMKGSCDDYILSNI